MNSMGSWCFALAGQNGSGLGMYAGLFLCNHISGKRLLMLTQNDLKVMGMVSLGHRIDLHVSLVYGHM